MSLEFLDNFVGRTLESLDRFMESKRKPLLIIETNAGSVNDHDRDAWERAKAKMSLAELGRWEKMNLAESRTFTGVCSACGAPTVNGKCQYEVSENDRNY